MIITPARFEDEVRSIVGSNETKGDKIIKVFDLMIETLDSLGYGAGLRHIKEK